MMTLRERFLTLVPGLLLLLLFTSPAWAGNTGSIKGRVVDARTADPIPFATVQIDGTSYGTASDDNGDYFILNVAPGTYTVKATFVGYQVVLQQEVSVRADQTTDVNFMMQETGVEGDTFVVIGTQDVINLNAAGDHGG